ncbi:hypothetical protein COK01_30195, partial [Priestia megaterium]
ALRGDRVDLRPLRGETGAECGEVVLDVDAAVGRQVVGERGRREEGIVHGIRHRSSVVGERTTLDGHRRRSIGWSDERHDRGRSGGDRH